MSLKIDQEFKNLISPLSYDERELLEKNIIRDGCRDPIVVWDGTIIDGHNRYEICTKHDIEFKTVEVRLSSRDDAIHWIIYNQLGRRNIPPVVKTYLIGRWFKSEKKAMGGDKKSEQYKEKSVVQSEPLIGINTVSKIAEQAKVSEATVKRAEIFAEAIDTIAENTEHNAMKILLETTVTQEEAKKVASFTPDVQKEIVKQVMTEKKTFKEVLKPIVESEQQQEIEKIIDTDYCACVLFVPTQAQIMTCPCGCGHGYCSINDKWYDSIQIKELKEV